MTADLDRRVCNRCGEAKSIDAFYLDKRRNQLRTMCKACFISNQSCKSGKRTPEQRAEYRRRTGCVSVAYVPKAVTLAIAAEKRVERESTKHSAHVKVWRRKLAAKQAREAMPPIHDEHVRLFRNGTNNWRIRYKTDHEFALKQRLRTQQRKQAKLFPKLDDLIRDAIKRGGTSRTVADVCGYTIAELKSHLERQFTGDMSWDAFMRGEIHIDHIKPQRLFNLADVDDVRACWSLGNLQPLWERDNLTKSGKWDENAAL